MVSRSQDTLSAEAMLVLGYLTGAGRNTPITELARVLALSQQGLRQAVDELLSTGRVVHHLDSVRLRAVVVQNAVGQDTTRTRPGLEHEQWQRVTLTRAVSAQPKAELQVFRGQTAAREELARLYLGAEHEILSVTPRPLVREQPGERNRRALERIRQTETTWPRRGLHVVWLSHAAHLRDVANRDVLHRAGRAGERLHTAPGIVARLIIVDRKVALVPLDPDRHDAGAVLIRSPEVVADLLPMFYSLLAGAQPLDPAAFVSPIEHEVLCLLASGAKDEAIARKLEISTRTVRRIISALLVSSGADSRFQLALHAIQVGWLMPGDLGPGQAGDGPARGKDRRPPS